jgi:hypothetical protein
MPAASESGGGGIGVRMCREVRATGYFGNLAHAGCWSLYRAKTQPERHPESRIRRCDLDRIGYGCLLRFGFCLRVCCPEQGAGRQMLNTSQYDMIGQ